jgi:hypothetical protein
MNRFSSSFDSTSRIISICVGCLAVALVLTGIVAYIKTGRQLYVLGGSMIGPLVIVVLMVAMYVWRPLGLEVNDTGIAVRKMTTPWRIDFYDIASVRKAQEGEMAGSIRTFGNGGLFGYTGMYYNGKLGSMRWFCTQRKNYVIIETKNNKRIVITPDEPDELLAAIDRLHPGIAIK